MTRRLPALAALAALILLASCGSDESDKTTPQCGVGEVYNPLSKLCQPGMSANNNDGDMGGANNGNDASNNNTPDATNNTPDTTLPDVPPSDRCMPGVDTDGDGLNDDCECSLNTSPLLADTDGDGLDDGVEDANGNCRFEPGETDPRQADTDFDGASDSEEIAAGTDPLDPDSDDDGIPDGVELNSCLDPFSADTDMDGLPDGTEDGNLDGEIGVCPNRMFDYTCAQGESDPCSADTDGDGTPDADEAQYRDCRPEDLLGLITPQIVMNATADYQLGLDPGVATAAVTGGAVQAHAFEHAGSRITGFIASFTPPNGETLSNRVSDYVVSTVQGRYAAAVRRVSGRQITTHDGHKATVGAVVDLPAGTALEAARDAVLADLAGVAPGTLSSGLTGTFAGDAQPTLLVYEIIARSATQYVIVASFVTQTDYENNAGQSGILVDDITGGSAVANAAESLADDCVAYTVTVRPKVDIIISIDGSGSMSDEQQALQNFAIDFTTLLTNSNLDWRAGVTRADCGGDTNLSPEAKALFSGSPGCGAPPIPFPIPGFPGTTDTGELVAGDFTADPQELETRLAPGTFSGGGEYTASALTAAADLALPRSDTDGSKFRTDAAVILIAITDEEDAYFQDTLSWGNSQILVLDPAQQTELENKTQPWVSYLLKPELGATMFGIAWPPSEQCSPNGSAVAHAVAQMANETGGSTGSICQADITNTLTEIANATAGIASGLRLRGVPLPPTIEVTHGSAQTGNVVDMPRSRVDGFDYDSIVNRVSFTGPMPPQTNDRVIMPYRRWENSVFMCTTTADCPAEQKLKCVDGECR